MCDPVTIGLAVAAAAVTAGGQLYGASAESNQQKYRAAVAQENRKVEIAGRNDASRRGELEQMKHWRKVAALQGEQRARMGASGLDLGFGSAADILLETDQLGYEDSATIGENTKREVEGYEIRAANYTNEARAAKAAGKAAKTAGYIGAAGTILGAASQLSGKAPMKGGSTSTLRGSGGGMGNMPRFAG